MDKLVATASHESGLTTDGQYRVIYTDGACSDQHDKSIRSHAGIGIWLATESPLNVSAPYIWKIATSNRAELMAVVCAILHYIAQIHPHEQLRTKHLIICSDSDITVRVGKGEWKRRSNLDRWTAFDRAVQLLSSVGCTLHLVKVLGHSGDVRNQAADVLAREGAQMHRKLDTAGYMLSE